MKFQFTVQRPSPGVMKWKLKADGRSFDGVVEKPRARVHTMMLSCMREAADALSESSTCTASSPHLVMWLYEWLNKTNFAWVFDLDAHRLKGSAPKLGESREAVERFKF